MRVQSTVTQSMTHITMHTSHSTQDCPSVAVLSAVCLQFTPQWCILCGQCRLEQGSIREHVWVQGLQGHLQPYPKTSSHISISSVAVVCTTCRAYIQPAAVQEPAKQDPLLCVPAVYQRHDYRTFQYLTACLLEHWQHKHNLHTVMVCGLIQLPLLQHICMKPSSSTTAFQREHPSVQELLVQHAILSTATTSQHQYGQPHTHNYVIVCSGRTTFM